MQKTMSVREAVLNRHATKVYLNEPAPAQADLDLITDAGLWAPTSSNIQSSQVIVITNKQVKEEIKAYFHEPNHPQVETAQALFIFIGTPWTDAKKMRQMLIDHSIKDWGLPQDKVETIADGNSNYYENVFKFKPSIDIIASATQMGMMMLQATELGYETNGMLGFEPETMKAYLVSKGWMGPDQRVNVTFTMGHMDPESPRNKLVHSRAPKSEIILEIK